MSTSVNIWETLLRDSSKRGRLPEGAILFVGNSGCGKSSLVRRLCAQGAEAEVMSNSPDILRYDSFVAGDSDEGLSDNLSSTRVGVWSASEMTFQDTATAVVAPNSVEKFVICIGIDLSKPSECRNALIGWLRSIKSYMSKHISVSTHLRQSIVEYLSSVRQSGAGTGADAVELTYNFGVPIIVVGCKADCVSVNDGVALKVYNEVQRDLRSICLKVGAALIYTSALNSVNLSQLKRYIIHRMYTSVMPLKLDIEHSSSELFVPSGLDKEELIALLAGYTSTTTSKEPFTLSTLDDDNASTLAPKFADTSQDALSGSDAISAALEDEQAWLAGLQAALEQNAVSVPGLPKELAALGIPQVADTTSPPSLPSSFGGLATGGVAEGKSVSGSKDSSSGVAGNVAGGEGKEEKKRTRRQSAAVTQPAADPSKKDAAPESVRGFFESLLTK